MSGAPFIREIEACVAAGAPPRNLRLIASEPANERWRVALTHRKLTRPGAATLLPPGVDPLSLRWPSVPLIADVTGLCSGDIRRLAQALARDGALPAFLIDRERPERSLHITAR